MEEELGEMHQGKKDAHDQHSFDRITDLLLEETPEIDLLRKRYADELIEKGACGRHYKHPPSSCHEVPEGQEYKDRYENACGAIPEGEPQVDPFPKYQGDREEKKRNQVSQQ